MGHSLGAHMSLFTQGEFVCFASANLALQDGEEEDSREEADECIHGVGPGIKIILIIKSPLLLSLLDTSNHTQYYLKSLETVLPPPCPPPASFGQYVQIGAIFLK